MDIVTGAIANLIPKLGDLLGGEYKLHKGVKKNIEDLWKELESMNAALTKIGEVPRDQLDSQDKLWADDVRELSYVIEDVVDKFLVRVDHIQPDDATNKFKGLMKRTSKLLKKVMDKHGIAHAIKDIKKELQEVAARRDRNKFDGIASTPTEAIDPRLRALYIEAAELVGIYGKRDQEVMSLLSLEGDDASTNKLKKVSIVGFGGLGKTTLARAVYEKIKGDFGCHTFVPVGQNPDIKKVFRDILIDLRKSNSDPGNSNSDLVILDATQLIDKLREFLENKSYTTGLTSEALRGWINRDPSHLSNLSELSLNSVKEVQQEDVEIIGGLLSLRRLWIKSTHQTQRLLVIRADGFRCMVVFHLNCGSAAQIRFESGALPRAEEVSFSLGVRVAKEDGNCGFDLGLQGSLLSLRREVWVLLYCGGARVGEAKEAEAAVRHALEAHPNHPPIHIYMIPHIAEDAHDDDLCEDEEEN